MTPQFNHRPTIIRRLWQSDKATLVNFFQNLDQPTRRMRFCGTVSDAFLKTYAEGILEADTTAYGAFFGEELHGIAELRLVPNTWPKKAEAAFLVEPAYQEKGIGDALLDRVLTASQNRNIASISMLCLKENKRMQHLAKKHDAVIRYTVGESEAALNLPHPTPMTLFYEMFTDTRGYLQKLFPAMMPR
ncbi:GNAT family N-acetyltransferase [Sulfitobacter sp.]|uniref:GNAT family N-acetyltransferase n=1 Tax=Sulfitobacter sp. TaxID=1903071 RepID=UPI0032985050